MLHHPFQAESDLLTMDGQTFANFQQAFEYCQNNHNHSDDFYGNLIQPQVLDEFQDEDIPAEDLPNSWQALLNQQPGYSQQNPDSELGQRPCDLEYNWEPHVGKYPTVNPNYWKYHKNLDERVDTFVDFVPLQENSSLNTEQRQIYDLFINKYQQILEGTDVNQLLVNIDGEGGSGKSYLINMLSSHLFQKAEENGFSNPIFRAAPTGIAAHNIHGHTIHRLLYLPVKGKFQELSSSILSELQNTFKGIHFLIFDEKSMIGLQMMGMIDQRLRQIRPSHQDEYMGGFHCLLLGDFGQLPPIMQKPLYYADPLSNPLENAGLNAYTAFNMTIRLQKVMRQQGNSQAAFRTALTHFREPNSITESDWRLLSSRIASKVPRAEEVFANTVRIYSTLESVHEYNSQRLKTLKIGEIFSPILCVEALGTGLEHKKVSSKDIGLEFKLFLAIGTKVMLLENIWPEKGLVNGATGIIEDIVWFPGTFNKYFLYSPLYTLVFIFIFTHIFTCIFLLVFAFSRVFYVPIF